MLFMGSSPTVKKVVGVFVRFSCATSTAKYYEELNKRHFSILSAGRSFTSSKAGATYVSPLVVWMMCLQTVWLIEKLVDL
jgi:hypothetical protein